MCQDEKLLTEAVISASSLIWDVEGGKKNIIRCRGCSAVINLSSVRAVSSPKQTAALQRLTKERLLVLGKGLDVPEGLGITVLLVCNVCHILYLFSYVQDSCIKSK